MKRILSYVIASFLAATHAIAGVVPVVNPFYAGEEQTDARMIYVGGSDSGGKLAVDCHADFSVARDDSNVALNWCNLGTFKWTFGFFSFDGPRSEYPSFNSNLNGSTAVTFDRGDKLRMILEPGFGYTLPSKITDGVLSVELWVVNPSVETDEILIRFEDGSNVDLTASQFNMSGSTDWQHLVAVSDGTETRYYLNGSHVTTQAGAINFSGNAVINLGAQSFTGSIAAVRIHTEAMSTTDISHNYTGGVGLGAYLFYPIHDQYLTYKEDAEWYGDPTQANELSWRESEHFRSMWNHSENTEPEFEVEDIGNQIQDVQLPALEAVYTYLNEKSGKHLPHVSNNESKRGDGRKYKWIVGNNWGGNYSGWSSLELGFGCTFTGDVNPHEYIHGTDNHQSTKVTDHWSETHANFQVSWLGNAQVNPVTACPGHAHVYPSTGGNYYHDYLIWDHLVETPEFTGLYVTRMWNRGDAAGRYPPKNMEEMDPSPETPFNEEWVKCAAKNITWDYSRHPEYAEKWASQQDKAHLHFTLLEPVPYLDAGWYEPQKWRAPQQHGYNLCLLEPNEGLVTADLTGHIDSARGSAWSAMFVAVANDNPRYGSVFANGTQGSFNVQSGDDELYLVVVATPTNIMDIGIFGHPGSTDTDYRGAQKDRFPYQVLLDGTKPKSDPWRPTPGIDPSATVDGTAYVSPNASVGPNANILGNARVEDYATVYGTVRDNAVVSGYAIVKPNAIIRDDARVTDFARIDGGTIVENSAHVMEHARVWNKVSDYAVIKGNAINAGPIHGTAIIDGNYVKNGEHDKGYWFLWSWGDYLQPGELDQEFNQLYLEYQFEQQNGYRVWDTYGVTWGRLLNGPTYVSDNGGTALDLDGSNDFVDLHQSVAQFEEVSFDVDVKWDGGSNGQKLINFSNSTTDDEAWLSPSDSQGKLAFSITVGGITQVVRASNPLPSGSWKNVKLVTYGDTVTIHVDDIEWASSDTITHDIDEISANECYLGRGASGDNFGGRIDDFTVWSKALIENIPPEPNPSLWLIEPLVLDTTNVMMQAVTAFDNNPPVEYYFEETSGNPGGSDSDWQASTLYYDKGLLPGTQYTYKVRARDSQNNITADSVAKNVTTPSVEPGHFIQDAGGTVSIEAENYDGLAASTQPDHYWAFDNSASGYSGSGAMMALPNTGHEIDENYVPDASPRMDFNVKFNRAGTHYMHIRGYGSDYNNDACHGGINFQGPPALASMAFTPPLAYVWDNHGGNSEIVIPHPGIHKIHVYMREDGTIVDKIVITDTPGVPSEDGPPESERGGGNVGGQTGFNDDPDGDGIANGLENFFGTDPNAFSAGLTAAGVLSTGGSNTFTLTHPQNATPADDISGPAYSWSTDLQTFTADGASEGGTMVSFEAVVNNPEDGTTTVTATITGTIPDRLFVRLGVTQIVP